MVAITRVNPSVNEHFKVEKTHLKQKKNTVNMLKVIIMLVLWEKYSGFF